MKKNRNDWDRTTRVNISEGLQYQMQMPSAFAKVQLKRVYDERSNDDGTRVLVDRLWPRGLTKEAARVDTWLRDLAPSNELRKWYHTHTERWPEFRRRYLQELKTAEAVQSLEQLYSFSLRENSVTLLFASKNIEHNNATVLKELLEGSKKPPKGTRPSRKASQKPEVKGRSRRAEA